MDTGNRVDLNRILGFLVFGIALGYLEADVVVYLRHLYYPDTVSLFPLQIIDSHIYRFEIYREIATIAILLSTAFLSSKERWEVPFLFLFLFGIWDIVYYISLFFMINWPPSILSFDILFLIPTLWISPVICPVLVSLILSVGSFLILKNGYERIGWINIISAILGCILIFYSFLAIPIELLQSTNHEVFFYYIPKHFPWHFYIPGLILLVFGFFFKKGKSISHSFS
ncbi:hypothetical protein KAW18_00410 [candidate division WOR-3 bacterium]|nr:hypothetical protein [candidate division WOR-3 bacterium]